MKKILISLSLAVFVGVILFGIHAASGLDQPSQDPSTAGLVGPTFSGLTVKGNLSTEGTTTLGNESSDTTIIKGKISEGGSSPVIVDDAEGLKVEKDIDVRGGIFNGTTSVGMVKIKGGGLLVDAAAHIGSLLNVTGVITNLLGGEVVIQDADGVNVKDGHLRVDRNGYIEENLYASKMHVVEISSTTDSFGDSTYSGNPLFITDHTDVVGDLKVTSTPAGVGGNLDVLGELKNTGIGSSGAGKSLRVNDSMTVTGDLNVTGQVNKGGSPLIQNFQLVKSSGVSLNTNSSNIASIACPTGTKLVSCTAKTSADTSAADQLCIDGTKECFYSSTSCARLVSILPDLSNNTCYARAIEVTYQNESARTSLCNSNDRVVQAVAVCAY